MSVTPGQDHLDRLFAERARNPAARDELIRHYHGIVKPLAARYRGRGEPVDDLEQVAAIGLVNAVDRFDPDRGVKFTTYATATILGELKRHLRDKAWSVRVPRSVQERSVAVHAETPRLAQRLGRSPTIAELAKELGYDQEDVIEALDVGSAFTAASLNAPIGAEAASAELVDRIAVEDETLAMTERWVEVASAIRSLPDRERHILYLRFFEGRTQSEIAEIVGVSQMHVSRLLNKSLRAVRSSIEPGP